MKTLKYYPGDALFIWDLFLLITIITNLLLLWQQQKHKIGKINFVSLNAISSTLLKKNQIIVLLASQ